MPLRKKAAGSMIRRSVETTPKQRGRTNETTPEKELCVSSVWRKFRPMRNCKTRPQTLTPNLRRGAGSPFAPNGINNPFSPYGSPFGNQSATNPFATDAPRLYDQQGNYRGTLSTNPYDPDSTSNPFGRYGSPYSPDSINNPFGAGSPYRPDSPNNPYGRGWRIEGNR